MSVIGAAMVAIADREPWQHRGACRGHQTPDIWFPTKDTPPAAVLEARAICVRCNVRQECLLFAMNRPDEPGIWGGLTESERAGLRAGREVTAVWACAECSTDFLRRHHRHRYCSEECQTVAERRRDRLRYRNHRAGAA